MLESKRVCNNELEAQGVYIDELVSEEGCIDQLMCRGDSPYRPGDTLMDQGEFPLWTRGKSPYGPGGIPLMGQGDSFYRAGDSSYEPGIP